MPGLNPRQRQAVQHTAGPVLVLAGAGSGKTRVISHKIAYLIGVAGLLARHLCAVTFTNKAAREMRARVAQQLRGREARGLTISTFHSLGLGMLRREAAHAGLRPGFSLFDAQDSETLIKEHLAKGKVPDGTAPAIVQTRISRWKNDLIDPERALSQAEDDYEATLARLYGAYERSLRAYNAVDFDDLIGLPVRLLADQPEIREAWQHRIRYLLVDEYQDTNGAQYELVRQLVGPRGALTAVGDDDQSIYAWRGARPENLTRLRQDYPHLAVIMLEQNYRSSGQILALANGLIAHNPHLFAKRLWSEHGPGESARVLSCRDETHEAERVIGEILHRHFAERVSFGDCAILYRGNHQARPFEKALREHNIPYFLSGGTSFFARTEVKDAMAYLRLLANPDDDAAFLRIVNTPRREIGPTTLERLADYAAQREIGLLRASAELGLAAHLSERARQRLADFAARITGYARRAEDAPVAAVRELIQAIDYESWLRETASSPRAAERRMENITDLLDWLEALHKGELQEKTLAEMVNHLTLMDVLERRDEEQGGERVHLMTLHAAKGLEFPHVYLVGLEEELLPHRTSIDEDTIEEERRLAYVGITRAQRTLTLTLARHRRRYGELIASEPSRFLAELPPEALEWADGREVPAEERKTRGQAHLAGLRGLLGG